MESEGEVGKINVSHKVKFMLEKNMPKQYKFTKRCKLIRYYHAGLSTEYTY